MALGRKPEGMLDDLNSGIKIRVQNVWEGSFSGRMLNEIEITGI